MKAQHLNMALYEFEVTTLGPGYRAALWVQGCNFRCKGCLATEWQPLEPAILHTVQKTAALILDKTELTTAGFSISGGEPMLQASALNALLELLETKRPDWNIILFSGYTQNELIEEGREDRLILMDKADAFIGGKYIETLNEPSGLRGSSNQEIFFKKNSKFNQIQQMEILNYRKKIEVRISREKLFTIGIPYTSHKKTQA